MAWDPNIPTPEGYRIYQRPEGQAYDYSRAVWTGTGSTATIDDLNDNQLYYFVARAYTGLDESADSNEITVLTAQSSPPPVTTYTISVESGEYGSISPNDPVTVDAGNDQSFAISPDTGYHIADVAIDGVSVGALNMYTFDQVASNHTIRADFAIDTHTIAAVAGANGTISPDGDISIPHGSEQLFIFTPDTGYHVSDVKIDGVSKGTLSSYTFSQVAADRSIAVSFSKDTFTIPDTAEANLAWDASDPTQDGYSIYQRTEGQVYDYSQPCWTGTGTSAAVYNLDYDTTYFFVVRANAGNLQSTDSNEVIFSAATPGSAIHTLTATAGANGSISPSGATEINTGANLTYAITANPGYHVSDVIVNGISIGVVNAYTFSNVTADQTISASFAVDTYALTASAGANGGISPSGTTQVNRGESQTYTITPNAGYRVSDVNVDGISIGVMGSYTFTNVASNHRIGAVFEVDTFTISATAGANGSISPADAVTVDHGRSQTFTFTPDVGYHVADVKVDGQSVGLMNSYTFIDVIEDHTLSVLFSGTNPVNVWIEAEDGDLQLPMEIADDKNASAGGYVWVPEGTGSNYNVLESAGFAEYAFDLPESGEYVVWGRQVSNDGASDSFFISIDGQPDIVWHTRQGGQEVWTWDRVSLRDAGSPDYDSLPERFILAAGPHTLRILQREDGTKLDKILITNQMDLTDPESNTGLGQVAFGDIQIDHNWTRVEFEKPFENPVVVAGPISLNGGDPAVIRIRNVDSTGFEIRLQEWDYLDGSHATETVSYLVMEAGSYTLDDGTKIEAAVMTTSAVASFQQIDFSRPFSVAPVVMSTLTSFNEAETVTGRIKQITTDGFSYRMQEQEANARQHATETLSYIAWEPSSGDVGDFTYLVDRSADAVKHKNYPISFKTTFASSPVFLADMQTADGGDTASVRYLTKDGFFADVLVDEEQSRDTETNHTSEVVGYMLFAR